MADYSHNASDITAEQTSNTSPLTVLSSGDYSGYDRYKAFNHSISSPGTPQWASDTTTMPVWIGIDFGVGKVVTSCTISATPDQGYHAPKTFKIQGANQSNFSDAVDLSSQSNITFANSEMKTFTWANTTAYRYFRIYITVAGGGVNCHIGEIEIFETISTAINGLQKIPHDIERYRKNDVELLSITNRQRIGTVGTNKHNYIGA
jgi:hypothetical protein